MRLHLALFAVFALAATAFAGCTESGQGSASVYVKDAPTDEFDEIHVVYTKVEVSRAGDNETDGGWVTLFENATGADVDLLSANGSRAAFLGEETLEAGRYGQIRVHVLEAYGVRDGERVDFRVPSGTLKVVRSFEVEAGMETRIVLDFDLDRSLKETGNGDWIMTPVVGKTLATVVEDAGSGEDVADEGDIQEVQEAA